MEANTGNKGGPNTMILVYIVAFNSLEGVPTEGNVPIGSVASSWGQTGVGQECTAIHHPLILYFAHHCPDIPGMGGNTPIPNPTAATITPRPASSRPATPPSLERLARELKELKSSGLSNKQRLEVLHDQRRQLLSHMATAKSEIDRLEVQHGREESIGRSQEILDRLQELNELHKWAGQKWRGLGDKVADLEGEIAMPGSRGDGFSDL